MANAAQIPVLESLSPLLGQTDLIICDLWGVMHDGIALHKGSVAALLAARAAGVKTVFLTNAPRPRFAVADQLKTMGLPEVLLDLIVTSGGLARDHVRRDYRGAKCFHLGPHWDSETVEDLPISFVESPDDADIIFATGPEFRDLDAYGPMLEKAAARSVPFLCANPDRIVHEGDHLIPCAGAVADRYIALGGPAYFYGKPERFAYDACFEAAGFEQDHDGSRVLMIGDSARTDILGANNRGIKGLLITSGIHRDAFQHAETMIPRDQLSERLAPHQAMPDYLMRQLAP